MSLLSSPDSDFFSAAVVAFEQMQRQALGPDRALWGFHANEARRRAEAATEPVIQFDWVEARVFTVDRHRVPWPGRGLVLAWMTLASQQLGITPPPLSAVFSARRPDTCALQALDRAARAVRPISAPLADLLGAMGTHDGRLEVKRVVGADIRCASPMLARVTSA